MKLSTLPESIWNDLFALFMALVRVARKSLPAHALGFVPGGAA